MLDESTQDCRGSCSPPAPTWYSLPLGAVERGSGICGSGFAADCTPPTRETSLGTVQIKVTWEQGNSSGRDDRCTRVGSHRTRDVIQRHRP